MRRAFTWSTNLSMSTNCSLLSTNPSPCTRRLLRRSRRIGTRLIGDKKALTFDDHPYHDGVKLSSYPISAILSTPIDAISPVSGILLSPSIGLIISSFSLKPFQHHRNIDTASLVYSCLSSNLTQTIAIPCLFLKVA